MVDSKADIKTTFNPAAFILTLLDVFVDWDKKAKFRVHIFTGVVDNWDSFSVAAANKLNISHTDT